MRTMCAFGMWQCCSDTTLFMLRMICAASAHIHSAPCCHQGIGIEFLSLLQALNNKWWFCRSSFHSKGILALTELSILMCVLSEFYAWWCFGSFVILTLFCYAMAVVVLTVVMSIVCTWRLFVIANCWILSLFANLFACWNFCTNFAIWRYCCEHVILLVFCSNLGLLYIMRRRQLRRKQLFAAQQQANCFLHHIFGIVTIFSIVEMIWSQGW